MRRYIHFLFFAKEKGGINCEIGVFSSKKRALEKIETLRNQKGFRDYPKENFVIEKKLVEGFSKEDVISGKKVYWLDHCCEIEEGENTYICWTHIGFYRRKGDAEKALNEYKQNSRLGRKYPDGFYVLDLRVDDMVSIWDEGFSAWDDNEQA